MKNVINTNCLSIDNQTFSDVYQTISTLKTQKSQPRKESNTQKYEPLVTEQAKALCPGQNAINLSTQELTDAEKSLLRKGPSFIPNPTDIN